MEEEEFLEKPMPEPGNARTATQSPQAMKRAAAAALPGFAQAPWPQPPRPQGAPPILVPADEMKQQIAETHGGVRRLQTLLDPPETPDEKGRLDIIVDLLETIAGQQRSLNERLSWTIQRQASMMKDLDLTMKALNLRIPSMT
jgi:hypothetical protein